MPDALTHPDAHPRAVLVAMRMNLAGIRLVNQFLIGTKGMAPENALQTSFNDLSHLLEDSEELIEGISRRPHAMGASRLPKRAVMTPEQMIVFLADAMEIWGIEVEALLREGPGLTEEQEKELRRRRDGVLKLMGSTARFYKEVIKAQKPHLWTSEVEEKFKPFLKLR